MAVSKNTRSNRVSHQTLSSDEKAELADWSQKFDATVFGNALKLTEDQYFARFNELIVDTLSKR